MMSRLSNHNRYGILSGTQQPEGVSAAPRNAPNPTTAGPRICAVGDAEHIIQAREEEYSLQDANNEKARYLARTFYSTTFLSAEQQSLCKPVLHKNSLTRLETETQGARSKTPLIIPSLNVTASRGESEKIIFLNGARVRDLEEIDRAFGLEEIVEKETHAKASRVVEELKPAQGLTRLTVSYPMSVTLCTPCQSEFTDFHALCKHFINAHTELELLFKCSECKQDFRSAHGASVHYGRCKGRLQDGQEHTDNEKPPGFKCEVCEKEFPSKIGLGQHRRFAHPAIANKKRLEAIEEAKIKKKQARALAKLQKVAVRPEEVIVMSDRPVEPESQTETSNRVKLAKTLETDDWSFTDLMKLARLERKFQSCRLINKEIEKELPGHTNKQIASKRRVNSYVKFAAQFWAEDKEATSASPPVNLKPKPAPASRTLKEIPGPTIEEQAASFTEAVQTGMGSLVLLSGEVLLKVINKEDHHQAMSDLMAKVCHACAEPPVVPKTGAPPKGRRKQYADTQHKYKNQRSKLAKEILDSAEESQKCKLEPSEVEKVYGERFGGVSQEVDLDAYPEPEKAGDNNIILDPISQKEVKVALGKMKKGTAPGPDRISVKGLQALDRQGKMLTNIFNAWLVSGKVPDCVKANRSILLPKGKTGLDNINNWRPLTISSVVLRLYTNILAKRFSTSTHINPRQRGFTQASGCEENVFLLRRIISQAKSSRKPLCVTFLDLAKAFDTVSHKHLVRGLKRFKYNEQAINIIVDLYKGAETTFKTEMGETGPIPMTRGVKQGDPLSPILFNIAMDPLLAAIASQGNGHQFSNDTNDRLPALAYADDNAMLTESEAHMNFNLEIVAKFCQDTGMRLNVKKSACFKLSPGGHRSWVCNDFKQGITVGGEAVPVIDIEDTMKYLGSKISPWVGVQKPELITDLSKWLRRLSAASLKPRQKLDLLKTYLLPRLAFPTMQNRYSKTKLRELDFIVRTHVRNWFHLPASSSRAQIHMPLHRGGLGVDQLEYSIPAKWIDSLRRILNSNDPVIRKFATSTGALGDITKISDVHKLAIPTKPNQKVKWRKCVEKELTALTSQMRGDVYMRNPICNTWNNPKSAYLSESEYITTLKLRSDTYPCKSVMARAKQTTDVLCRHCRSTVETIGHISGRCRFVKDIRIKRHNLIAKVIEDKAKQVGWAANVEPTIKFDGQTMKPDLVLHKEDRVVIIDPTIVYESGSSLEDSYRTKTEKYGFLDKWAAETYGVPIKNVEVHGLAVGSLGGWTTCNDRALRALELSKVDKKLSEHLSRLALKGTLNMIRKFMDD